MVRGTGYGYNRHEASMEITVEIPGPLSGQPTEELARRWCTALGPSAR